MGDSSKRDGALKIRPQALGRVLVCSIGGATGR